MLGPPLTMPESDPVVLARMSARIGKLTKFLKDLSQDTYFEWRLSFTHWIWGLRALRICESLLGQVFMEAPKDGAQGVYTAVLYLDPRIVNHGGRPSGIFSPYSASIHSSATWEEEERRRGG